MNEFLIIALVAAVCAIFFLGFAAHHQIQETKCKFHSKGGR